MKAPKAKLFPRIIGLKGLKTLIIANEETKIIKWENNNVHC
ncbi:hypothetical protein BH11BAC7_BH11BAC7_22780 [soil metagenome]